MADLPPLALVLRHGLPPAGGPTGRTRSAEGSTFVELGPGLSRMASALRGGKGDALGRLGRWLRRPCGNQPRESGDEVPVRRVSCRRGFRIADSELTNAQCERWALTPPRRSRTSRCSPRR